MGIRILHADDHALFRDMIAIWLERLEKEILIHSAASLDDLTHALDKSSDYNLILLDLYMPGMQGTKSIRQICENTSNTPVIIVSAEENPLTISACLETGAAGYIIKTADGETVIHAIQQVLEGQRYVPPGMHQLDPDMHFTPKQLELLSLLSEGHSNKEIAQRMHLSEGTVRQYVSEILRIMNVDNRTQASIKARAILGLRS